MTCDYLIFSHNFFDLHKNFRLLTPSKTSGTTQSLTLAPEDSIYNKVFQNNVDDKSYTPDPDVSFQRILKEPKTALWTQQAYALESKEFQNCMVSNKHVIHSMRFTICLHLIIPDGRNLEKVI